MRAKNLHHIFYQYSDSDCPWALEVSANLDSKGIFHDMQVAVYCELMETLTLTYETSRDYNLAGAAGYIWSRLDATCRRCKAMPPARKDDFQMFNAELNQVYDKIMFGEG